MILPNQEVTVSHPEASKGRALVISKGTFSTVSHLDILLGATEREQGAAHVTTGETR